MNTKLLRTLNWMLVIGIVFALSATAQESSEKYWNFDELAKPPAFRNANFADSESIGLQAIVYDGVPVNGKAAPVFAYIGYPNTPAPAGGYPGIVLVHGGGGTAYPNYAKLWIEQGYAVIMPDWYNRRPLDVPRIIDGKKVSSVPLPGGYRHDIQISAGNLVLAHSLLLSLPKVNPEKTAYVGLSWGSWFGAIVAAVDSRFKGVVEIYCGDREPNRKTLVDGRFLHSIKVPVYWVCSTNDQNVTPESLQRAFDECPTTVNKSMVIQLPHSHIGFTFKSCFRMADYFLKGEPPLPVLDKVMVKGNVASVKILNRGKGIIKTVFCYTQDRNEPKTHKRVWKSIPATMQNDTLSVELPKGIYQGFFSAYDEESPHHDCCGSSNLIVF